MRTTTFTITATAALLVAGAVLAPGAVAAPRAAPAPMDTATAGAYTAVSATNARILDTRTTNGGAQTPVRAGTARTLQVAGRGGVPASGASSVVLNVTVTGPTAGGFLSVYPAGGSLVASNLNFVAGQVVANLVTVQLPASGAVSIVYGGALSSQTVDVVADVQGWFAAGTPSADGAFAPISPARLLDTRTSTAVAPFATRNLLIAGSGAVPTNAGAVVLNVTDTGTTAPGFTTVYPTGNRPTASNLNFVAGQTVPNLVVVPVSADGQVSLYNGSVGSADLVVDVFGYFLGSAPSQSGMFGALTPARVLDTRDGTGAPRQQVAGRATLPVKVVGAGGVPTTGVSAVVVNVTAVNSSLDGFFTVYSGGTTPLVSTLNFRANTVVPNLAVVPVASDGTISIYNGSFGTVDIVADVTGYVRNGSLSVPGASTSRYVNDLKATQTNAQIAAAMKADGKADAAATSGSSPHLTILEFGAQSAKAGGDGTGNGSQLGVSLPAVGDPGMRLTYAQVQTAFTAYLDGYAAGRPASATGTVTVALGTNSAGFLGATYSPANKGADWAAQVKTAAAYAAAQGYALTVVGADDIEANFSATADELRTWIGAYRAVTNPPALINNGATAGCPSTAGVTNQSCGAVRVDESPDNAPVYNTWSQTDYVSFSSGTGVTIAPQIYYADQATRWENILLSSGGNAVRFAGVLTQVKACQQVPASEDCESLSPTQAWATMNQALDAYAATASLVVPAVTDIRYP